MHIFGSTPRLVDRSQWRAGSTYESANQVGSHPADSTLSRIGAGGTDAARSAAIHALRREGFGPGAVSISDPRASDAMMQMRPGEGVRSDYASVLAAYGENSE